MRRPASVEWRGGSGAPTHEAALRDGVSAIRPIADLRAGRLGLVIGGRAAVCFRPEADVPGPAALSGFEFGCLTDAAQIGFRKIKGLREGLSVRPRMYNRTGLSVY